MEATVERSERLSEEYSFARLPSGLGVWYIPRKGFAKKVAILSVRFGSIHEAFSGDGSGGITRVPAGTAHFLEHRIFETGHGDAFDLFERLGASSNAATGHTTTTYFFSCTENFYKSLEILLGFLDRIVVDEGMVEREKKIIIQEILGYQDSPDWQGFMGILQGLYWTHPVRLDISGTVESVAGIDADALRLCYSAFYHPSNVDLFVSGDLDMDELLEFVGRTHSSPRPKTEARPVGHDESTGACIRYGRKFMPVPKPRLHIGFKELQNGLLGEDLFRRNLATNMLLYAMFGASSDFYMTHYRSGLIDTSFSASFRGEAEFAYTVVSAETDSPGRLKDAVLDRIAEARREGVPAADIARAARRFKGRFLKNFNSPESAAFSLMFYAQKGASPFSFEHVLDVIDAGDIKSRAIEHFDFANQSVFVVSGNPDEHE